METDYVVVEALSALCLRVSALNRMVMMQQTIMVPKTPDQLQRSAIAPTPQPARDEPKTYPKKPVKPAAVPAAFFGTRSKAWRPISMIGP